MQLTAIKDCFKIKDSFRAIYHRGGGRYAPLDGIRAISIISIIVFHCQYLLPTIGMDDVTFRAWHDNSPVYYNWIANSTLSVDMFFVLSGFLIGNLLLNEFKKTNTLDLKRFYFRRLLRLYPVYLFFIGLGALMIPAEMEPELLWYNVFHIVNFLPFEDMRLGWTWSLAVEEQFYLFFPLTLLLAYNVFKRPLVTLIMIFLSSFVVRMYILADHPEFVTGDMLLMMYPRMEGFSGEFFTILYDNLYTRYGALAIGSIGAYLHVYHAEALKRLLSNSLINNGLFLVSTSVMVVLFFMPMIKSEQLFSDIGQYWLIVSFRNVFSLFLTIFMLCLLYASGLSRVMASLLAARAWFPVAQLSYSIYLFHLPVAVISVGIIGQIVGTDELQYHHLLWMAGLCLFLAAIPATLTFILFERPFMAMRALFENTRSTQKTTQAMEQNVVQARQS